MKDLTGQLELSSLCLYVADLEFTLTEFYSQPGDKKNYVSVKVKCCYKSLRFMKHFLQIVMTCIVFMEPRDGNN